MEEVRYAVEGDVHIAFREIIGDPASDRTVVLLSGMLLPTEMMWADHVHAKFVDGLAALGRLIVFDRRGIGMSDPITEWDEPVAEQWLRDCVSVLDAANVESAIVVGWEMGGNLAFRLASRHPDRVARVVVFHGIDRMDRLQSAGWQTSEELASNMEDWIETGEENELISTDGFAYAQSRRGDNSLLNWLDQAGRLGASPMMARRIWRSLLTETPDVDLAELNCPTQLLWRPDNNMVGSDVGKTMTEQNPLIEYVELSGTDWAPFGGDVDELVREIELFVTGDTKSITSMDRRMSAVLFTDIVDSTVSAALLGDDLWRGTLDEHDRLVDLVVSRRGGSVVKHTGDGTLAIFDLASSAVRAAGDLRDELRKLDLVIRQGIHVGEITVRDDDVSGVAVHVAARIMSLAEPGEILTSAAVPMLIEGDNFTFELRGEAELRGLKGVRTTYAVKS